MRNKQCSVYQGIEVFKLAKMHVPFTQLTLLNQVRKTRQSKHTTGKSPINNHSTQ